MFDIVLYQPEIPPNTGNIIRLAANTGATLHLVEPLGFRLDDRELKRAGLDYHEYASLIVHKDWERGLRTPARQAHVRLLHARERRYTEAEYRAGDALLFGPETRGLPPEILRERAGGTAPAPAAAARQPQPQPFQCGRGSGVRSLAAAGLRRRLSEPMKASAPFSIAC